MSAKMQPADRRLGAAGLSPGLTIGGERQKIHTKPPFVLSKCIGSLSRARAVDAAASPLFNNSVFCFLVLPLRMCLLIFLKHIDYRKDKTPIVRRECERICR